MPCAAPAATTWRAASIPRLPGRMCRPRTPCAARSPNPKCRCRSRRSAATTGRSAHRVRPAVRRWSPTIRTYRSCYRPSGITCTSTVRSTGCRVACSRDARCSATATTAPWRGGAPPVFAMPTTSVASTASPTTRRATAPSTAAAASPSIARRCRRDSGAPSFSSGRRASTAFSIPAGGTTTVSISPCASCRLIWRTTSRATWRWWRHARSTSTAARWR